MGLFDRLSPLSERAAECAVLADLIADPASRLISLTGPGGVGKTTLARWLIDGLQADVRFAAFFVDLSPIVEPSLAATTIGHAVVGRSTTMTELIYTLNHAFPGQRCVLVLDNLEQLPTASDLVRQLIEARPATIVVTSRESLHLPLEHRIAIQPLAVPAGDATDLATVAAAPAARLFIERLREARPDFLLNQTTAPMVATICRRVDGLPLALELAAARTTSLPLPFLVDQLTNDVSGLGRSDQASSPGPNTPTPRHHSLTSVAAWSYGLLDDDVKRLFRRLSVLPDAFPRSVVAHMVDHPPTTFERPASHREDEIPGRAVDAHLETLVDKSLLMHVGAPEPSGEELWYRQLTTLREFGARELEQAERTVALNGLALWLVESLVRVAAPFPESRSASGSATDQLRFCAQHLPTIRSVMTWLFDSRDLGRLLQIAVRVGLFWVLRSYRVEGLSWCRRILAVPGLDALPSGDIAALWLITANLARTQQDDYTAMSAAERARDLYAIAGDIGGVAGAGKLLGSIRRTTGDYDRAVEDLRDAERLYGTLQDHWWLALTRCDLGATLLAAGRSYEAFEYLADAEDGCRSTENDAGLTYTLVQVATGAVLIGRPHAAIRPLATALGIGTALRLAESQIDAINVVASLALVLGRPALALRFLLALDHAARLLAYHLERADQDRYAATLRQSRTKLSAADVAAIEALIPQTLAGLVEDALDALDDFAREGSDDLVPTRQLGKPTDAMRVQSLTAREHEILTMLAEGLTDSAIADRLFLSRRTAMRHVANIFGKLDVHSRSDAAAVLRRISDHP